MAQPQPDAETLISGSSERPDGCAYDLRSTLRILAHGGAGDPTIWFDGDGDVWRAARTVEGPVTWRATVEADDVRVRAWGPGADWVADRARDLLGLDDDPTRLVPVHPPLREIQRRHTGLRLASGHPLFDLLAPTILLQRVTVGEGHGSWARIVRGVARDTGDRAPGPTDLLLPPAAADLGRVPAYRLRSVGVDSHRAAALRAVCRVAHRLDEVADLPPEEASAWLQRLPRIGPWTAAFALAKACGWPDAVPLGDYNLPNAVSWTLTGVPRADDERMLELLEPYRGQRWRALRLIKHGGRRAPRRGPRHPLQR